MLDPVILVFVLLSVLIAGGGGYLAWKAHTARLAAWAQFAQRYGMSARGLRLEGTYHGLPLSLETQMRGSGRNRYTVAVLRLPVSNALPPEFSLEREGLEDKLLRLFGQRDPEIGDERFDQLFELKNLSPATASVLREEPVQRHLYAMVKAYQHFHIRGGWLQAERRRIPASVEDLEEFPRQALMLAHTLELATRRP
jgi:hypothetical protein